MNLDLLGKITGILESYFLLGSPLILQVWLFESFFLTWLTSIHSVQTFATELLHAILEPLTNSHTASVNVKDLIAALNMLMQQVSISQWGEAMHTTGLFAHIMEKVLDPKVCALF